MKTKMFMMIIAMTSVMAVSSCGNKKATTDAEAQTTEQACTKAEGDDCCKKDTAKCCEEKKACCDKDSTKCDEAKKAACCDEKKECPEKK